MDRESKYEDWMKSIQNSQQKASPWPMLVFLIFLVLKLTGHITWSWWWVTAPLWGPLALIIAFVLVVIVLYCIFWPIAYFLK